MMERPDTASILAFLQDECLRDLQRVSAREYLTWDQMLQLPLPQGMSAVDTWNVLGALRRISAIFIAIPDVNNWVFWYTPTQRISATISQVEHLCRKDSPLHQATLKAAGRQFIIKSRVEEAIASAMLEGLGSTPADMKEALLLGRAPRTSNERLVANTIAAAGEIEDYVDERFTPELLQHLYDRVLDGVNVDELVVGPRRRGVAQEKFDPELLTQFRERQIRLICDYANGDTADALDHSIVRALIVRDALRGYQSFPPATGPVAWLVFALYAIKAELPVLAMLPLAKASLEWEAGTRTVPPYGSSFNLYQPYSNYLESDITPFITITLLLLAEVLDELQVEIKRDAQRDEEVRGVLHSDVTLNHRQRSVLGRALRDPDAEFGIRYHRTKHNVAYATARADLMKLAEMGYLRLEEQGQKFVFKPGPRLDELVGRM